MDNIKVVCINDANRPESVPTSRWIKKGENYTIIKVEKMLVQGSILGCKLAEINNDDLFPYTHFSLNRFRPLTEDEQMAETSVEELIKELDVVAC